MNKHLKTFLIVLPICFVLAGVMLLSCFLAPDFGESKIAITVVLTVWAFLIVPAVLFAIDQTKQYLVRLNYSESFRIGYVWGGLIFLALVFTSPITGILWFAFLFRALHLNRKQKQLEQNGDVFDL